MREIRTIIVEEKEYPVTISDECTALQAAYAAGGAIIGVINPEIAHQSLKPADYAVEAADDIDQTLLEQVVRRRNGLPWLIAETDRLLIREFTVLDPLPDEKADGDEFQVFTSGDKLLSYIDNQYTFYGYGIWALVEKNSGLIIGKAGVEGQELGYHIYAPHRGNGYAKEASRTIIRYAFDRLGFDRLYLTVKEDNEPSIRLAERLGFRFSHHKPGRPLDKVCIFELNSI